MKSLVKNTVWSLIAYALDRGALVIVTMILSHSLSNDDFASFGFLQITITTVASFAGMGIGVAASRLFAEFNSGMPSKIEKIAALWLLSLVIGCIFTIIFVSTADLWRPIDQNVPLLLMAVGIGAITFGLVGHGGILGLGLFKHSVGVAIVSSLTLILFGAAAAHTRSQNLALIGLVLSYILSSSLAATLVARRVGHKRLLSRSNFSRDSLLEASKIFGPLTMVTILASSSNWLLGRMLLTNTSAQAEFTAYIVGLQWYTLALLIPGMVTRAAFPSLVRNADGEVSESARSALAFSLKWGLISAVIVAVCVVAASPILGTLYDESMVRGGSILWMFSIAALPSSIANAIGNALVASGYQVCWLSLTTLWFVFLLIFGWQFNQFGAYGTAGALFLSGFLLSGGAYFCARKRGLI